MKNPQKKAAKILQDSDSRDPLKVGILGCGRVGSQLAHCLLTYAGVAPKNLKISTRRPETLGIYILIIKLQNCAINVEYILVIREIDA